MIWSFCSSFLLLTSVNILRKMMLISLTSINVLKKIMLISVFKLYIQDFTIVNWRNHNVKFFAITIQIVYKFKLLKKMLKKKKRKRNNNNQSRWITTSINKGLWKLVALLFSMQPWNICLFFFINKIVEVVNMITFWLEVVNSPLSLSFFFLLSLVSLTY